MPWDDANNEFNDADDDDLDNTYIDGDRHDSPEDDRALRGTSQCDSTCDPQCQWCLVAHDCDDICQAGHCPYDALEAESKECEAREVQCLCQWEAGDSPCPLHGEEEVDPRP